MSECKSCGRIGGRHFACCDENRKPLIKNQDMTPNEKAGEIIDSFYFLDGRMSFQLARECALVAVNEILSMGIFSDSGDWRMAKSYWEEVKQHIYNSNK